jgi:hypothetical protein
MSGAGHNALHALQYHFSLLSWSNLSLHSVDGHAVYVLDSTLVLIISTVTLTNVGEERVGS